MKFLKHEIIAKFGEGWVKQDPEIVMALIASSDLKYYESTFEEPTTSWDRVKTLWDVVPDNQSDVSWWHEILVEDDSMALAHVKVTRTLQPSGEKQNIDAAFLFGFNDEGKINYFRQWRELK
ncbi:MAG: nuclear transport factor 2 family protein [Candidatus Saccharimonadales bacterium]|nr:nuclear transport factor 2 family protein [Candidatus Saccharimonadales bacterium]